MENTEKAEAKEIEAKDIEAQDIFCDDYCDIIEPPPELLKSGSYTPQVLIWQPESKFQYHMLNGYKGTAPGYNRAMFTKVLNVVTCNMVIVIAVNEISYAKSLSAVFTVSLPYPWYEKNDIYPTTYYESNYIKSVKVGATMFNTIIGNGVSNALRIIVKYYPGLIQNHKQTKISLPQNYFTLRLNIMYRSDT